MGGHACSRPSESQTGAYSVRTGRKTGAARRALYRPPKPACRRAAAALTQEPLAHSVKPVVRHLLLLRRQTPPSPPKHADRLSALAILLVWTLLLSISCVLYRALCSATPPLGRSAFGSSLNLRSPMLPVLLRPDAAVLPTP